MRMNRGFLFVVSLALALHAEAADQREVAGLSDLPPAAQSTISAALGRDLKAYAVRKESNSLRADNNQQHLVSDFTATGVNVHSGPAMWRMKLERYGYGKAPLTSVPRAIPEADGNRSEERRVGKECQ